MSLGHGGPPPPPPGPGAWGPPQPWAPAPPSARRGVGIGRLALGWLAGWLLVVVLGTASGPLVGLRDELGMGGLIALITLVGVVAGLAGVALAVVVAVRPAPGAARSGPGTWLLAGLPVLLLSRITGLIGHVVAGIGLVTLGVPQWWLLLAVELVLATGVALATGGLVRRSAARRTVAPGVGAPH